MQTDTALRQQLASLLTEGNAHVNFDAAILDLPSDKQGLRPAGPDSKDVDHSPWELLEHLRIAQADILDFCRNPNYKALEWPKEYWPEAQAPPTEQAWEKSVQQFRSDLKELVALVLDPATDLYSKIPHGEGQTILREALLTADHNAYHLGQLILTRKLLGAWKA